MGEGLGAEMGECSHVLCVVNVNVWCILVTVHMSVCQGTKTEKPPLFKLSPLHSNENKINECLD